MTKICKWCGKIIKYPKSNGQKYHKECFKLKKCEYCGKEYLAKKEKPSYHQRFCSHSCSSKISGKKGKVKRVITKCKNCGKEFKHRVTSNRKYCSRDCSSKRVNDSRVVKRVIRKCLGCGKRFKCRITSNQKYCSYECNGRIRGQNTKKILKELKMCFYNPEFYKKYLKKAHKTQKRLKIGLYDPLCKAAKKGIETQKKNKIGFFNSKFQSEMGKRGGKISGPIVAKILREKKEIKFNKIYFDSYKECEIGMCIHYQIEKLREGKNYQVNVGGFTYDFLIRDCFIECHPYNSLYDGDDVSLKKYYCKRRGILNKKGYNNYPLIIIK